MSNKKGDPRRLFQEPPFHDATFETGCPGKRLKSRSGINRPKVASFELPWLYSNRLAYSLSIKVRGPNPIEEWPAWVRHTFPEIPGNGFSERVPDKALWKPTSIPVPSGRPLWVSNDSFAFNLPPPASPR